MIDLASIDRIIAIQFTDEKQRNNIIKLIKDFNLYGFGDNLILFSLDTMPKFEDAEVEGLKYNAITIPSEYDYSPKQKNFIISYFEQHNFKGFLHIIEENVILDKDPTTFTVSVENAMSVLDYNIYFSTTTDPCNYVFNKFSPRLIINMDDDDAQKKFNLPKRISFTSHSNVIWTIYKMDGMNNIQDEVGVFHILSDEKSSFIPSKMKEEDALFKSMNIDYAPDNNLDLVLDALYAKIKKKI